MRDYIPFPEYLADPRFGSHQQQLLLKSGSHAKHGIPLEPSGILARGSAVHSYTLEPDKRLIIAPDLDLRSHAGKDNAIEYIDDYGGDISGLDVKSSADKIRARLWAIPEMTLPQDARIARDIAASVYSDSRASDLLESCAAVESTYYTDLTKARIDFEAPGIIGELKSTSAVTDRQFANIAERLGYGFQAAHYEDARARDPDHGSPGCAESLWIWIVVQTKPDRQIGDRLIYPVQVFEALPDIYSHGRDQHAASLEILEQCRKSDSWPGPAQPEERAMLSRPEWTQAEELDLTGIGTEEE